MKVVGRPIVLETAAHVGKGKDGDVEVARELRVLVTYVKPGADEHLSCDCSRVASATHLMVWHSPECPELENA